MALPKTAWGRIMTSPAACESGAGEQIVDLVVLRYMERMVCWFWITTQWNGCSTPASRSSATKQWNIKTRSNDYKANDTVFSSFYWFPIMPFHEFYPISVALYLSPSSASFQTSLLL